MLGYSCGMAQTAYWVFLRGNCGAPAPAIPASVLSKRPLPFQNGLQDLPVCESYLAALRCAGFPILAQSRWLNAVVLKLEHWQLREVESMPFVASIQQARQLSVSGLPVTTEAPLLPARIEDTKDLSASFWAYSTRQLALIGSTHLQINRYTGKGIRVAVFDNGFPGVDRLPGFQKTKVLATRDVVHGEVDVYNNTGTHGTMVLSTLAAYQPGGVVGAAFDADYLLAVTEDDGGESLQEEYNWVVGAEWADSLGADIFTTSLGYTVFDDSTEDHFYSDLDGNTTVITRAADAAAQRGILVINSAGNEGASEWRYISAPADGDSVLAIGSVNPDRVLSGFSGSGPTADGRIKPDLVAQGERVGVLDPNGMVRQYNGTSFSGPVVAGMAAQLMEAIPGVRGYELALAIRNTGTMAAVPDNDWGYGIPDGRKVYQNLTGKTLADPVQAELMVYPNPARGKFTLSVVFPGEGRDLRMEIWNMEGKKYGEWLLDSGYFLNEFSFSSDKELGGMAPGLYFLKLTEAGNGESPQWIRLFWEGI